MIEKTQFQIDCDKAIANLLSKHGLVLEERQESETIPRRGFGAFILIEIRVRDYKIWIYDDQVDLFQGKRGFVHEGIDYDNIQDQIDAFLTLFEELLLNDRN